MDTPLQSLAFIVSRAVHLYSLIVLAAVVISWVNINPSNPIVRVIRQLTDPPLNLIRKYLPFVVIGGLDLSPIVLLLGAQMLAGGIARLAYTA